jgi:hypothetical protein
MGHAAQWQSRVDNLRNHRHCGGYAVPRKTIHLVIIICYLQHKAVVWVPQRGSYNSVVNENTFPLPPLPKDDLLLQNLEPLGLIKMAQALELSHLSPTDVTTQAKLMAEHPLPE